jgi:hypothetical protein
MDLSPGLEWPPPLRSVAPRPPSAQYPARRLSPHPARQAALLGRSVFPIDVVGRCVLWWAAVSGVVGCLVSSVVWPPPPQSGIGSVVLIVHTSQFFC